MRRVVPAETAAPIDLAGHNLLTHAIDREHAMRVLCIDGADAEAMIRQGQISSASEADQH